jgi:hypothetical protein
MVRQTDRALDAARASMGLGPYVLPRNSRSLSADKQIFILANLDRLAYGLTPIAGLSAAVRAGRAPGC